MKLKLTNFHQNVIKIFIKSWKFWHQIGQLCVRSASRRRTWTARASNFSEIMSIITTSALIFKQIWMKSYRFIRFPSCILIIFGQKHAIFKENLDESCAKALLENKRIRIFAFIFGQENQSKIYVGARPSPGSTTWRFGAFYWGPFASKALSKLKKKLTQLLKFKLEK